MIRTIKRHYLRKARQEALKAYQKAKERGDTRDMHSTHKRAQKALHDLMRVGG